MKVEMTGFVYDSVFKLSQIQFVDYENFLIDTGREVS